jgi:hypothetical protein
MNNHLKLISSSIFSPRVAVDLARQHSSPFRLGLTYLVVFVIVGFVLDFVLPLFFQPLEPKVHVIVDPPFILDDPWIDKPLDAFFNVLVFFGPRFFWRKMLVASTPKLSIDAVLATTFASNLALIVPDAIVSHLFENSSLAVNFTILIVTLTIFLALGTIYGSHAFELSIARSFCLNALLLVILIFIAVAVGFALILSLTPRFPGTGSPA